MHMAIVVLSVLLTLLFGFTGTTEVFNTTTARNNAAHLGISAGLSRMIGAAEIAAAIGVLASMAEFERELVRERTALKRQASRANGTGGRSPGTG